MSDHNPQLLWTQPDWLGQAHAWIHTQLKRQGIRVNGSIEQPHIRPWSTVLRVPTTEDTMYFKATAPAFAHEAALTQALARWQPDRISPVLAVDLERSWMLMPDGGKRLREVTDIDNDVQHWETLLTLYAELQIVVSKRLPEMLALGTPDKRLGVLPTEYQRLLADTNAMRIGLPDGLTLEEYERLREFTSRFAEMCQQLASYRIPEAIEHGDLHDGNIFIRAGRYLLFDWGDSCVTHPFFSMIIPLRMIAMMLNLTDIFQPAESDPKLAKFRDIYLKSWESYESRENLLLAFKMAQRVGLICRALTWYRVLLSLPEGSLKEEYADTVPSGLKRFLNAGAKVSV